MLFAAQYVGGLLVTPLLAFSGYVDWIVQFLNAAALFFIIYTMPAAANGGIPGQAAINVSVEQARANPAPTILLTVVYVLANNILPIFFAPWLLETILTPFPQLAQYDLAILLIESLAIGVLMAYAAVMMAKVYNDLSTRRFFFGY